MDDLTRIVCTLYFRNCSSNNVKPMLGQPSSDSPSNGGSNDVSHDQNHTVQVLSLAILQTPFSLRKRLHRNERGEFCSQSFWARTAFFVVSLYHAVRNQLRVHNMFVGSGTTRRIDWCGNHCKTRLHETEGDFSIAACALVRLRRAFVKNK